MDQFEQLVLVESCLEIALYRYVEGGSKNKLTNSTSCDLREILTAGFFYELFRQHSQNKAIVVSLSSNS